MKGQWALVSRTRSSHASSANTFANFGFKRDTRIKRFLVSLWFGSSLRSKLRMPANFRTATLAALVSATLVALAAATGAQAQNYPSRPVTVIVPFAAGG